MTGPPLLLHIAYRLFAWRLGPTYQAWTHDDITRRGYTLRQAVPVGLVVGGLLASVFAFTGADPRRAVPPIVGVLVLAFFLRKVLRERALRQQGLSHDGEAIAPWFGNDAERNKRNINGAVLTTALVVAGMLILGFRED